MTEWPALFVEEMVRAVIEDRKTLTRRIGGFWHKVKPGDRLYIRETWRGWNAAGAYLGARGWVEIDYRADGLRRRFDATPEMIRQARVVGGIDVGLTRDPWRPSIHQPRWATRELLEVVSNREEPLHAITEEDAVREGIDRATYEPPYETAVDAFRSLWDSVNGDRAPWKSKPDVHRVEFRRLGDGARVSMEGV